MSQKTNVKGKPGTRSASVHVCMYVLAYVYPSYIAATAEGINRTLIAAL